MKLFNSIEIKIKINRKWMRLIENLSEYSSKIYLRNLRKYII